MDGGVGGGAVAAAAEPRFAVSDPACGEVLEGAGGEWGVGEVGEGAEGGVAGVDGGEVSGGGVTEGAGGGEAGNVDGGRCHG